MKHSAGLAVVRRRDGVAEVLLVHPGGPYWAGKDDHAWSIPKGELDPDEIESEAFEAAARREFTEETGHRVPAGPLMTIEPFAVGSGKRLHPFAVRGDLDETSLSSNHFEMEWPPRSGQMQSFPEVDRALWVPLADAVAKLHKGQAKLVARLESVLDETGW